MALASDVHVVANGQFTVLDFQSVRATGLLRVFGLHDCIPFPPREMLAWFRDSKRAKTLSTTGDFRCQCIVQPQLNASR